LCGPPSIPLSFILANVLPRWYAYCVNCVTEAQKPQQLAYIVYSVDYQGI
jgi:hypothetical protein